MSGRSVYLSGRRGYHLTTGGAGDSCSVLEGDLCSDECRRRKDSGDVVRCEHHEVVSGVYVVGRRGCSRNHVEEIGAGSLDVSSEHRLLVVCTRSRR